MPGPPPAPRPPTSALPPEGSRWRCSRCGNLTRFDVTRSSRVREFVHLHLSGEGQVEEVEVLAESVESVCCRWCNADGTVEVVPRAASDAQSGSAPGAAQDAAAGA